MLCLLITLSEGMFFLSGLSVHSGSLLLHQEHVLSTQHFHTGIKLGILQEAMEVRSAIFHARIPIGIRAVANLPDLKSLILHLWKHCSTGCSFETTDF
jgi:hypothetical protein